MVLQTSEDKLDIGVQHNMWGRESAFALSFTLFLAFPATNFLTLLSPNSQVFVFLPILTYLSFWVKIYMR